ncbi:hypothetical protein [Novipirellula rosea]|uniref:Uncharacterized protein n=1 Tax=Novipirellula rosea TaxID=1031540 RepID=A0ABP8MDR3_9BACT
MVGRRGLPLPVQGWPKLSVNVDPQTRTDLRDLCDYHVSDNLFQWVGCDIAACIQGALLFGTDVEPTRRRERVSFKELQKRKRN